MLRSDEVIEVVFTVIFIKDKNLLAVSCSWLAIYVMCCWFEEIDVSLPSGQGIIFILHQFLLCRKCDQREVCLRSSNTVL